jgi:hypothetical protein
LEYQIPKVLTLSPENGPGVRSGHNITINGQFFGYHDSTPGAAVVGTACETVSWTSDTTISCIISHGLASPPCAISGYEQESLCYALSCNSEAAFTAPACRTVKVEIGQQRGSIVGSFSFDRPQLDFLYPSNSPARGGTNFGSHSVYHHKVVMGNRKCANTFWTSDSAIMCETAPFVGKDYAASVEVFEECSAKGGCMFKVQSCKLSSDNSGTCRPWPPMLSYDVPSMYSLTPAHAPTTLPETLLFPVTFSGTNFGTQLCGGDCKAYGEIKVVLGDTMCYNTNWIADSSIVCTLGQQRTKIQMYGVGVGKNLKPKFRVGGQPNDQDTLLFSFDKPNVIGFTTGQKNNEGAMKMYATNGISEGGHALTVFGNNFGVFDYTPLVTIGESSCRAGGWVSDTAILCTTSKATRFDSGANADLPLRVMIGLTHLPTSFQEGVMDEAYTYDYVVPRTIFLTYSEINILAFIAAFILSGCFGVYLNRMYAKSWPQVPPSRCRQKPFKASTNRVPPSVYRQVSEKIKNKVLEANPDSSSSSDKSSDESDGFYDYDASNVPKDRDKVSSSSVYQVDSSLPKYIRLFLCASNAQHLTEAFQ